MNRNGQVVGVDVGGTKCLAVLLDSDRTVVAELRVPMVGRGAALLGLLDQILDGLGARKSVSALGIGLPGLVDRHGVLRFAPNLPGAVGQDVAVLAETIGIPVVSENDATCAMWGERELGAAKGLDDVVLITVGTGIGGGIVAGGRLHRGAGGFSGEVGHMVVDVEGPHCGCGQRGCWEVCASGSALGRMAREAAGNGHAPRLVELAGGDPGRVQGEHVTSAAAEGDTQAMALVNRLARWLAVGLANLARILDPRAFVMTGGLLAAGDVLLRPLRDELTSRLSTDVYRGPVDILPAGLGERAGAIGAACLADARGGDSA